MTKMYQVADTTGEFGISDEGFAKREDAKGARDYLNTTHNGGGTTPDGKPRFVVCRGEDHPHDMTDGHDHTRRPKWI